MVSESTGTKAALDAIRERAAGKKATQQTQESGAGNSEPGEEAEEA